MGCSTEQRPRDSHFCNVWAALVSMTHAASSGALAAADMQHPVQVPKLRRKLLQINDTAIRGLMSRAVEIHILFG